MSFSTDPLHFGPDNWSSATLGTPDYYNKCSIGDMDVPRNWAGISNAHSGVGYAGIYAWNASKRDYREYIQCKLIEPLKPGIIYRIQFFYRLSLYSVYAIDRIGCALASAEVKADHDKVLNIKPAFTQVNDLETLTNAWYMASTKVRATGGEQYLVIGNFSNNDSTESMKIETRDGKSLMLGSSAYYYIDDVSVIAEEADQPVDIAQMNEPPQLNEVYVLKNIQFQFNSYELLPSSFKELDVLIGILQKNPKWSLQLSGHTDDLGSDEYNLVLSKNRVKSVRDYLIQKGIPGERIQAMGFGKQKPLHPGSDDQARALNRRVEARFLDK